MNKEDLQKQQELLNFLEKKNVVDTRPIAAYLCNLFKVSDPKKIFPFGQRAHAHQIMKQVTLGFESVAFMGDGAKVVTVPLTSKMLNDPEPKERFRDLPADFSRVSVYSMVCRYAAQQNVTNPVGARLNFYHNGVNKVNDAEGNDEVIEASGGIKGAFYLFDSKEPTKSNDIECVPMPENSACNEFLARTMTLLNERNITNDVIQIPFDVCKAANLPVALAPPMPDKIPFAPEATPEMVREYQRQLHEKATAQGKELIQSFAAIPFGHVLSWPLRSEEFAAQIGIRMWYFTISATAILYYLVSEPDYKRLLHSFKAAYLDKVDMRPLSSIAIQYVTTGPLPSNAGCKLRGFVNFYVPPLRADGKSLSQETIDNLAVTLPASVPSPENWLKG